MKPPSPPPPPPPLLHRHSWQNISAGVKCGIFQNIVQMEMAFFVKTLNDMCIGRTRKSNIAIKQCSTLNWCATRTLQLSWVVP